MDVFCKFDFAEKSTFRPPDSGYSVYFVNIVYELAVDHTTSKEQDPIRTPLRSDVRPGQYWAGGPPGNTKELTALIKEANCSPDSVVI